MADQRRFGRRAGCFVRRTMGADPKAQRAQRLGFAQIFGESAGSSSRKHDRYFDDRHHRPVEYPFRSRYDQCNRGAAHTRRAGHLCRQHTGLEMGKDQDGSKQSRLVFLEIPARTPRSDCYPAGPSARGIPPRVERLDSHARRSRRGASAGGGYEVQQSCLYR